MTTAADDLRKALAAEEGGRLWLRRVAIFGGIAAVVAAGLGWRATHQPPAPSKFVTQTVTVGDVIEKVQATGAVQPLLQVNVGAQVNGRVTEVDVDFNSVVKKGQVLAVIDPTLYGQQVTQAQANLSAQRAQLDSAKATLETARINYDRLQKLYAQNLSSRADVDAAKGQYDIGLAGVASAKAAIAATDAQLSQSMTNVTFTKIYSPVDGIVVTRSIDPGATVVASFQSPVLFVIAQDLKKMRVLADIDEADVGKLRENMEAEAVVDAFPGETFKGIVEQVRYSPNNVSGVVTYSAVVDVDNPESKLRPGMTATVTIKTREAKGVPRVPNSALRFKPTPESGPDGGAITPPPESPLGKGQGRVHLLVSDKPGDEKDEERIVSIGVTDGIFTELTDKALPVGTKIVTDELDQKKKKGP
ncbi:MAG TPA: efflux RND transporter periplasmic adaptor subunit [Polyangiaceae bacterium]|jgi:HlyD family secretion protein